MKTCGVCKCACTCVHARVFVFVFALCVVWHIFTEGCVLSLSFGVRPEAMSNWSLHTFRLDSHWHARPWLSSLCHEKGKQWHRNMPAFLLRRESLLLLISFCFILLFSFLLLLLSALRECYSLSSIWGDELFNHGNMISETCRKVITVSRHHHTTTGQILVTAYMKLIACTYIFAAQKTYVHRYMARGF